MTAEQQIPAGWYPDPRNPAQQRYWDGQGWTEHVHNPVAPPPPPHLAQQVQPGYTQPGYAPQPGYGQKVKQDRNDGLVVGGCIGGVLIPIVGAIIGFVLLSRKDPRSTPVFIVTGVGFVVWFALASSGNMG